MSNIVKLLLGLDTSQATKSTGALEKGADKANKSINALDKSVTSLGNAIKIAFQQTPIIAFVGSLKKAIDVMGKLTQKESDYIESLNLLYVAYDNNADSAERLINNMNQLLGLDHAGLTKQLGVYRQFSSAMGIAGEKANLLSENLLKLQADVSSLYNLDFATAGKKLQSALAGQTRPVRELGADITEASLQQELYNRGIDKSVDSLNRASKSVLIYLTLERQLRNANQDAGATIDQLAQQMKVFKEQTGMAARQLGAVFIPVLKAILPYANALLMVFNDLLGLFLKLIGVDASKMAKEGIANRSTVDFWDDYAGGLDKTTEAAKKAKLSLRGFDKLNNITTPSNSGGGGGVGIGGALGGVDQSLLDALKEYDLGEISQKAAKIRDSIMDWLGFAKDVNGEWKFSKLTLGTIVGALIGGGGLIWGLSKVWNTFRKIKAVGSGVTSLLGLGKSAKVLSEASTLSKATKSFTLPSFKTVLTGLGELATIIVALGTLVLAIGELTRIPGFKEVMASGLDMIIKTFKGLGEVLVPIAAFSAIAVAMGLVTAVTGGGAVFLGILALATLMGGLEILVLAIGGLLSIAGFKEAAHTGIEEIKYLFTELEKALNPIGKFSILIVGLGLTSLAVVPGILALAAIIDGLSILMASIGAISKIPYVKEFVESGADMLIMMSEKLGEMAGALIKGFIGKTLETIPDVGTNLTLFMQNAKGFFEGLKYVPEGAISSVKTLTEAMLLLTANSFLQGIMNFVENLPIVSLFVGKKQTLADFGDTLNEFAPKLISFSKAIKPLSDEDVAKTDLVAGIVKKWVEVAKDINRSGTSLLSLCIGNNSLGTFGAELRNFSVSFVSYTNTIKDINSSGVQKNKQVIDMTREWVTLSKDIERQGTSLVSLIAGNNSLGAFGVELRNYGASFKTYGESIKSISFANVDNSVKSTDNIIDVAIKISRNKLASDDNNMGWFGVELRNFGASLKTYYDSIKGIDATKINQVTDGVNMLVYMAKDIKNSGVQGYLQSFSKELSLSTTGINSIFSIKNGENIGTNFGKAIAKKIASAIKSYSFPTIKLTVPGLAGSIATYSLKAYQNGGFVDSGDLFFANENGVNEYIGHIGSNPAVANNDQIIEGISIGVAKGMQNVDFNQPTVIKAEGDTSGLLNFINFEQEKRNRQYGL